MKEDTRWKLLAALGLVTLSLALYTVHFLIFQDAQHILIYLIGDIAFLPIEVLVVTLIIDEMLESREKQQRMEKLNLVIGTFFSTEGTPLLTLLAQADPNLAELRRELVIRDLGLLHSSGTCTRTSPSTRAHVSIDQLNRHTLQEFLFDQRNLSCGLWRTRWFSSTSPLPGLSLALGHLTA